MPSLLSVDRLVHLMRSPNPAADAGADSPLLDQIESAVNTVRNVATWAATQGQEEKDEAEGADADESADAEAGDETEVQAAAAVTPAAAGAEGAEGEDGDADNGDESDDADEYAASDTESDDDDNADSDVVDLTPTAARPLRPLRRSARGPQGGAAAAECSGVQASHQRRVTRLQTALQESSQTAPMAPEQPAVAESPAGTTAAAAAALSVESSPSPPQLPLMEMEEMEEEPAAAPVEAEAEAEAEAEDAADAVAEPSPLPTPRSSQQGGGKRKATSSRDSSPAEPKRQRRGSPMDHAPAAATASESGFGSADRGSAECKQQQLQPDHPHAAAAESASTEPAYDPELVAELFAPLPAVPDVQLPAVHPLQLTSSYPRRLFIEPIDEALQCCLCHSVACDPPNLETCGHLVCRSCLVPWMRRHSKRCPHPDCETNLARRKLASQPLVQTLVARLAVRCSQAPACDWTGSFGQQGQNLIDHDAHCPWKELRCDRCDESLLRRVSAVHLQRECRDRVVVCRACAEPMRLGAAADHQPALRPSFAQRDVKEEKQTYADGGVQAAAASESEAALSSVPAASAAATSTAASTAASAAPSEASRRRLPPLVPPCIDAELCPRGCESVEHPGHVSMYAKSDSAEHLRRCSKRPVACALGCGDGAAHSVPEDELVAHVHHEWVREPARVEQQVKSMIVAAAGLDQQNA